MPRKVALLEASTFSPRPDRYGGAAAVSTAESTDRQLAEALAAQLHNEEYSKAFSLARSWWVRSGGIGELQQRVPKAVFDQLHKALLGSIHKRTRASLSALEQSTFWQLDWLDALGLFGLSGCKSKNFLETLRKFGRVTSAGRDDAIAVLRKVREARRRALKPGTDIPTLGSRPDWTPRDAEAALEQLTAAVSAGARGQGARSGTSQNSGETFGDSVDVSYDGVPDTRDFDRTVTPDGSDIEPGTACQDDEYGTPRVDQQDDEDEDSEAETSRRWETPTPAPVPSKRRAMRFDDFSSIERARRTSGGADDLASFVQQHFPSAPDNTPSSEPPHSPMILENNFTAPSLQITPTDVPSGFASLDGTAAPFLAVGTAAPFTVDTTDFTIPSVDSGVAHPTHIGLHNPSTLTSPSYLPRAVRMGAKRGFDADALSAAGSVSGKKIKLEAEDMAVEDLTTADLDSWLAMITYDRTHVTCIRGAPEEHSAEVVSSRSGDTARLWIHIIENGALHASDWTVVLIDGGKNRARFYCRDQLANAPDTAKRLNPNATWSALTFPPVAAAETSSPSASTTAIVQICATVSVLAGGPQCGHFRALNAELWISAIRARHAAGQLSGSGPVTTRRDSTHWSCSLSNEPVKGILAPDPAPAQSWTHVLPSNPLPELARKVGECVSTSLQDCADVVAEAVNLADNADAIAAIITANPITPFDDTDRQALQAQVQDLRAALATLQRQGSSSAGAVEADMAEAELRLQRLGIDAQVWTHRPAAMMEVVGHANRLAKEARAREKKLRDGFTQVALDLLEQLGHSVDLEVEKDDSFGD